MLKNAVIPPIPHLGVLGVHRTYHLVLTHLLEEKEYLNYYQHQRAMAKYIILDNSAHEFQEGQAGEVLLQNALKLSAQEVVASDALFNHLRTVELTRGTLEYWKTSDQFGYLHPQVMLVPQGETFQEYRQCTLDLINIYRHTQMTSLSRFSEKFTIGVSKDYEMFQGGLLNVLEAIIFPLRGIYKFDVHILGWGRDLWSLKEIFKKHHREIRSIDSAKPIVYGKARIQLDLDQDPPPYPTRDEGYFFEELDEEQLIASIHNIKVFDQIVNGEHNL